MACWVSFQELTTLLCPLALVYVGRGLWYRLCGATAPLPNVAVQCVMVINVVEIAGLDPLDPQFLSQVFDPAETAVRGGDAARQLLHGSTLPPAASGISLSSPEHLTGKSYP